jgi:hypothetical protein
VIADNFTADRVYLVCYDRSKGVLYPSVVNFIPCDNDTRLWFSDFFYVQYLSRFLTNAHCGLNNFFLDDQRYGPCSSNRLSFLHECIVMERRAHDIS